MAKESDLLLAKLKKKMNTNIQIFKNEMFGEIRTMINDKGETFFVGKDVAAALGYNNTRKALRDHVEKEDRLEERIVTSGQKRTIVLINESGLYALILSSKLDQAKAFKHWVTNEVLPQIRVTGGYIPTRNPRTGETLSESELVETASKIMARTISRANLPADDCMTASEVAQLLEVDVTMLNHFLVDKGIQYWNGSRYKLTAKYADCGYAEERLFHYYGLDGQKKQRSYMVWTQYGKSFIQSQFNNH